MSESIHVLWIAVGGTMGLGQLFLVFARSMPPPPPDCGYFGRWFYDAVQLMAQNQDKTGKTQDLSKPVGQATQTLTASAATIDVPKAA